MEFKHILKTIDACGLFLSSFAEGLIHSKDLHVLFTTVSTSMTEIGPLLSKCVLRAKEPDPEKRIYGVAQTERVLLAESRYIALLEGLKSVAAVAEDAKERLLQHESEALLQSKTVKEAALKSSMESNERDAQARLVLALREAEASALREKEQQKAVERLEEEAQARASLRAFERNKELAAAEKERAAAIRAEELKKLAQLTSERRVREERVDAIVAEAQKAGVGGGGLCFPPPLPTQILRTGIQQVESRKVLLEVLSSGSQSGHVVVGLFYASWCPQSTSWVSQTNEFVVRFPSVIFVQIDVDTSAQLAIEEEACDCPVYKVWLGVGSSQLVSSPATLADILAKHVS